MANFYEATCTAQLDSLIKFRKLLDQAFDESRVTDEEARRDIKLAVDEVCTNIIQHGYAGIDPGSIILAVELEADHIRVTITDFGCPFKQVNLSPPDLEAKNEPTVVPPGVFSIHQSFDTIEYQPSSSGNRLVLTRRMGKPVGTDQIYTLVSRTPFFHDLSSVDLQRLVQQVKIMDVQAGEVIAGEGGSGDSFFIIAEGELEVIKAMDTPEQTLLGVRRAGEFVGEMSLLDLDGRRTASLRALTPVRLIVINRPVFYDLIGRQPKLAYDMMQVLSARLRDAHDKEIQVLQHKNRELQQAYDALKAAQVQLIEKEKLEHELQVARNIQLSILPAQLPQPAGYELGALMVPARAVGGDFYDAFLLDDSHLVLIIGDVSDKGVPAALFMTQTVALLRAESEPGRDPGETLRRVSRHLLGMNASGLFVTVFFGILHLPSGEFAYARAGHELPLIVVPDGDSHSMPMQPGIPLAIMDELTLDEQSLHLSPGELLLLYTDGVTDGLSMGTNFKEDGLEMLQTLARRIATFDSQAFCQRIFDEVTRRQAGQPQFDDVTLLVMRVLGKEGEKRD